MFTVEQLLTIAKEKKASDVHVTVGLPPRVRINGDLVDLEYPRLTPAGCEKCLFLILWMRDRKICLRTEENWISHSRFRI